MDCPNCNHRIDKHQFQCPRCGETDLDAPVEQPDHRGYRRVDGDELSAAWRVTAQGGLYSPAIKRRRTLREKREWLSAAKLAAAPAAEALVYELALVEATLLRLHAWAETGLIDPLAARSLFRALTARAKYLRQARSGSGAPALRPDESALTDFVLQHWALWVGETRRAERLQAYAHRRQNNGETPKLCEPPPVPETCPPGHLG